MYVAFIKDNNVNIESWAQVLWGHVYVAFINDNNENTQGRV